MAVENVPGSTYDPCTAYVKLRDAHTRVLAGEEVRSVRFKNGDEERETTFAPSNLALLEKAMNQAKAECMASQDGARPRRSAIGIGFPGPSSRTPY